MMQGSSNEKEGAILGAILGVHQVFDSTGLMRTDPPCSSTTITNDDEAFHMTDLILWNVLGYALDVENFLNMCLVCKRWNQVAKRIEPPIIHHLTVAMKPETVAERNLELLRKALGMLQNRSSALYIQPKPNALSVQVEQHQNEPSPAALTWDPWPGLQPRFQVLLMTFLYRCCTQRSPFNFTEQIYNLVRTLLESIAEQTAKSMCKTVIASRQRFESWELLLPIQVHLFQMWCDFQGLVSIVKDVASYVELYYVKHHALQKFQVTANKSVAEHIKNCLVEDAEASSTENSQRFEAFLDPAGDEEHFTKSLLVLLGVRACQNVRNFPPPHHPGLVQVEADDGFLRTMTDAARLLMLKEESMDERLLPALVLQLKKSQQGKESKHRQEKDRVSAQLATNPVKIIVMPTKQTVPLTPHLLSKSSFLGALSVQGGESILLTIKHEALCKALEFYELDESHPFPGIRTPLPGSTLDFLPARYVDFANGMDKSLTFDVVTAANMLGLKDLLDLCSLNIALMIRGMSADELRAVFNI